MDYDLPFSWECHVIPTDELIFFRGVGIPPTSLGFGVFLCNNIDYHSKKYGGFATSKPQNSGTETAIRRAKPH
jgi:hypothetical protein